MLAQFLNKTPRPLPERTTLRTVRRRLLLGYANVLLLAVFFGLAVRRYEPL
jgi:hypothetical protein